LSRPRLLSFPASLSDGELVARARAGDRWGREALYRRYAGYLLGMVVRMLGRRDDAEEVVQDTFVAAFSELDALRDPEAVRPWLCQIAVSYVRRRLRKLKLLRALGLDRGADDATLAELASPTLTPEGRSELALMDRALARMEGTARIAWTLRHVDGLELAEVATLLGCSLATVKRRLAAAEAVLQAHVEGAQQGARRRAAKPERADALEDEEGTS